MTRILLHGGYFILTTGILIWMKLLGTLDWSWWTVTAPVWLPAVALGLAFGVIALILGIPALLEALDRRLPIDDYQDQTHL